MKYTIDWEATFKARENKSIPLKTLVKLVSYEEWGDWKANKDGVGKVIKVDGGELPVRIRWLNPITYNTSRTPFDNILVVKKSD